MISAGSAILMSSTNSARYTDLAKAVAMSSPWWFCSHSMARAACVVGSGKCVGRLYSMPWKRAVRSKSRHE
ncbi:hypothetical protein D9M72_569650 [compost metagenome]